MTISQEQSTQDPIHTGAHTNSQPLHGEAGGAADTTGHGGRGLGARLPLTHAASKTQTVILDLTSAAEKTTELPRF